MKKIIWGFWVFFLGLLIASAEGTDLAPNSRSAILIDYDTLEIIYEKNIAEKLPPASMTKIMSMLLVMEAVDSGKISLDDEVLISENASSMGGSQVYLQQGEKYSVHDLLKGVAIASGNDAVVALAEYISGTVEEFVRLMNEKAKELGLESTHFENPHGLDSENHYSSAYDMAIMATELLKHSKILEYTSIYEDYLTKNDGSNIWLVNTNKLIRYYNGVDGLKTGYTSDAGYCLTATAKKNDLRLIAVVMNVPVEEKRRSDVTAMLNYGFANYASYSLKGRNDLLEKKRVEILDDEIELYLKDDYKILLRKGEEVPKYSFQIELNDINGSIKANDVVGKSIVKDSNNNVVTELDIVVHNDYNKASFFRLWRNNIKRIVGGGK